MTVEQITCRKATTNDLAFTYWIKQRATRYLIEQIWGWDDAFQKDYHKQNFVPEKTQIILYDSQAIGFLVVTEASDEVVIDSILIDPDYHGKGIGTQILTGIITGVANRTKEIQVFRINDSARQLYERLGFKTYEETRLHYKMRKEKISICPSAIQVA